MSLATLGAMVCPRRWSIPLTVIVAVAAVEGVRALHGSALWYVAALEVAIGTVATCTIGFVWMIGYLLDRADEMQLHRLIGLQATLQQVVDACNVAPPGASPTADAMRGIATGAVAGLDKCMPTVCLGDVQLSMKAGHKPEDLEVKL